MKKIVIASTLLLTGQSYAEHHKGGHAMNKLSTKGHFQHRTESATNRQGVQATDGQGARQSEESFSRLRAYFTWTQSENLKFNLTPQATKGFGARDTSDFGTSASPLTTSGSTNHTSVTFFESNIHYKLTDALEFKLGRQEISYGDHLIIGALPWANAGRSFDALKFRYNLANGWIDAARSKINDNSTNLVSNDDTDFSWIYSSFDFGQMAKETDFYVMHQTSATNSINTIGFRVKGSIGDFFYRTENGIQSGRNLGDDAFQYNIEGGRKFGAYSISAEYALAGHDYIQMYPTAHKFMGFADVLSRRNLKQIALHLKGKVTNWFSFSLDYHKFERESTDDPIYTLGNAVRSTAASTSGDVGSEVDLLLNFHTQDKLKLQLGYALFMPGTYMKETNGDLDENTRFMYAQINAGF